MINDWINLKVGWIVSMCMPVVPWRFDIDYPAELQKIREFHAGRSIHWLWVWLFHPVWFCSGWCEIGPTGWAAGPDRPDGGTSIIIDQCQTKPTIQVDAPPCSLSSVFNPLLSNGPLHPCANSKSYMWDLQGGAGGLAVGWVDLDLGSSPGWWSATAATLLPNQVGGTSQVQVNKTQSTRTWDAL